MKFAQRWGWSLATALVLLGNAPVALPAAAAPADSTARTVQVGRAAPLGEFAGTLAFTVSRITPDLVTAAGPTTLTITGTIKNTGTEALTGLIARVQRGAALSTPGALQEEIANPSQPGASSSAFENLRDSIDPGATVDFTVHAAIFGGFNQSLSVDVPGVYPIMLNINAEFDGGPAAGARVGELHALLTVASVPAPATTTNPPAEPGISGPPAVRQPLNVLLPVVDRPHRDPTGAFFDDTLATLIAPGGRLDSMLRTAETSTLPAGSITMAVDPELLEELQLMSKGYTVGPNVLDLTRGTGSPPVAPSTSSSNASTTSEVTTGSVPLPSESTTAGSTNSTTSTSGSYVPVPGPTAVPGTGSASAAAFLDRLIRLAGSLATIPLPYTDIDAVAANRAGMGDQVTAAITRGQQVATAILGSQAQLIPDVGWPINGFVDDATLALFRAAGVRTAVLDAAGVPGATGTAAIFKDAGQVAAVLSGATVPTTALPLNTFTAVTALNYFTGVAMPSVFGPARDWDPAASSFVEFGNVFTQLADAGMVTGTSLQTLAAPSATAGTLDYPSTATATELPPAVFGRIRGQIDALASTQKAFEPTGVVGPGEQPTTAPTDLFVDVVDGLYRQASGGFQRDPGAANTSFAAVDTVLKTVQNAVQISLPAGVTTLTSSSSPLLLFIHNDLPYTVYLRVRVNPSDALIAGIKVQDVGLQAIAAGRTRQVTIPAEITRTGTLSVRVQMTDPDGVLWGTEQRMELRSTAYGSFTVLLIIGAAAVLVLTAAGRIRRRYKERQARIAAGLQ